MRIEKSIDRLIAWRNGKKRPPEKVQIYPTNICNLNCMFCVQKLDLYDISNIVPKEKWLEITKEICEMGIGEILISGGGEPLCTPDVTIGIMKMAREHDVEGRIISNGTLWTKSLIEDTIDMNWKHVIFSVDGPDSQTHDYLRGSKGAFKTTIKNIQLFKKLKEKKGRGIYDVPLLEMTVVLNIHNFMKIPELVKLSHKIGVKHVNVEALCVNNHSAEKIKLNEFERIKFFKIVIPKAKQLADSFCITTNFPKLIDAKFIEKEGNLKNIILKSSGDGFTNSPCYEPWLWPKIEADGTVCPCSTMYLGENIKQKSFREIWYGKTFQKFRERIIGRDLPDECNICVLTHLVVNDGIRRKLNARKSR